jgi:hypothetical protein
MDARRLAAALIVDSLGRVDAQVVARPDMIRVLPDGRPWRIERSAESPIRETPTFVFDQATRSEPSLQMV